MSKYAPTPARQERLSHAVQRRMQGIIVLEDVHDPHNAAAVLRTCDGLGFHEVFFVFEKEKPYNPRKVGKTSSSTANKWLDYEIFTSTEECMDRLQADGYETIATALGIEAESVFEAEFLAPKIALMFGNEHRGLSSTAITKAHRRILIPMAGLVESFNISVCAALVMYEVTRQRRAAGIDSYLLPAEAQDQLLSDFLGR